MSAVLHAIQHRTVCRLEWRWNVFGNHVEWCADGDGFYVVRCYPNQPPKLFDQGDWVANLPEDIDEALRHASLYMKCSAPEFYDYLAEPPDD